MADWIYTWHLREIYGIYTGKFWNIQEIYRRGYVTYTEDARGVHIRYNGYIRQYADDIREICGIYHVYMRYTVYKNFLIRTGDRTTNTWNRRRTL